MMYSRDQGLIKGDFAVDDLFEKSVGYVIVDAARARRVLGASPLPLAGEG